MVFKNICIFVFWTKVASALEGFKTMRRTQMWWIKLWFRYVFPHQDQEAARQHRRELAKAKQAASLPTVEQVFGTETVATDPQHEGDTLDESLDDPGKR